MFIRCGDDLLLNDSRSSRAEINPASRLELRQALIALVSGDMTNNAFDDLYYSSWMNSSDRGVAEIGHFGYGLYSSDTIWPYRLKGRHAVDLETQQIAQCRYLFLQTGQEYVWPSRPNQLPERIAWSIGAFFGNPIRHCAADHRNSNGSTALVGWHFLVSAQWLVLPSLGSFVDCGWSVLIHQNGVPIGRPVTGMRGRFFDVKWFPNQLPIRRCNRREELCA